MTINTTFPTGGLIGVAAISNGADTDQKYALGTRTEASNGQVWVYVQATTAISQYDCVAISNAFGAAPITKALADLGYQPANAAYAIALNSYGWVCIHGAALTQTVLGSCANAVALFTSAVAGALDDGSASQTKIWGAVGITSAGTTGTTQITTNMIFPHTQIAPFT